MFDAQAAEMVLKLLMVSGKFIALFQASVTTLLPVRKEDPSSFIRGIRDFFCHSTGSTPRLT